MCLKDAEELGQEMGNLENNSINTNNNNSKQRSLHCEILQNQTENLEKESPVMSSDHQSTVLNSFQVRIQSIHVLLPLTFIRLLSSS